MHKAKRGHIDNAINLSAALVGLLTLVLVSWLIFAVYADGFVSDFNIFSVGRAVFAQYRRASGRERAREQPGARRV